MEKMRRPPDTSEMYYPTHCESGDCQGNTPLPQRMYKSAYAGGRSHVKCPICKCWTETWTKEDLEKYFKWERTPPYVSYSAKLEVQKAARLFGIPIPEGWKEDEK